MNCFRVLALSATPGSDLRAVQRVLYNLNIARIEIRSEEDKDVVPYTHLKQIETIQCNDRKHRGGYHRKECMEDDKLSDTSRNVTIIRYLYTLMTPAVEFLQSHSLLIADKPELLTLFMLKDVERCVYDSQLFG